MGLFSSSKSNQPGFFARLKQGLTRTRKQLGEGLARLILGKKTIDQALLTAIEAELIGADLGVSVVAQLIEELTSRIDRKQLTDPQALIVTLRSLLLDLLQPYQKPLPIMPKAKNTQVILMVGVNGSGKTTTMGKLAHYLKAQGASLLLAAGDTFRAAAIEQLQVWGQRAGVSVIAQQAGADSAAVIYDALQAAKAREIDILLADTAGRLHTHSNLMEELKKIKRVLAKLDVTAPHETLLVLDATNGQNALHQAKQFHEAIGVTGIVLTKLDGTAKGGILFAISQQIKLPIYFIGVGEKIEDLQPFEASAFVDALLPEDALEQQNS